MLVAGVWCASFKTGENMLIDHCPVYNKITRAVIKFHQGEKKCLRKCFTTC